MSISMRYQNWLVEMVRADSFFFFFLACTGPAVINKVVTTTKLNYSKKVIKQNRSVLGVESTHFLKSAFTPGAGVKIMEQRSEK